MKVAGIEFPDGCPAKCPGMKDPFDQSGLCSRCPIFNCETVEGVDRKPFRMIEPEDYRKDWAAEWRRWFDGGMKGLPQLRLELEPLYYGEAAESACEAARKAIEAQRKEEEGK